MQNVACHVAANSCKWFILIEVAIKEEAIERSLKVLIKLLFFTTTAIVYYGVSLPASIHICPSIFSASWALNFSPQFAFEMSIKALEDEIPSWRWEEHVLGYYRKLAGVIPIINHLYAATSHGSNYVGGTCTILICPEDVSSYTTIDSYKRQAAISSSRDMYVCIEDR